METPKIYKTNAGLAYQCYDAYLLKIADGRYLCVGAQSNQFQESYLIGEAYDLEDYYIEESDYIITKSPLHGTYLFNHFLNTAYFETL